MQKWLIACEFTGTIRNSLISKGIDAVSCDLLDSLTEGPHYKGDCRDLIYSGEFTHMVAHPPCQFLANSGARWWPNRQQEQKDALAFVQELMDCPIPHIAIENPIGKINSAIRKPDCIVQPWMFGEGFTKATCFWLKNLPALRPSNIVEGREPAIWKMGPSKKGELPRWAKRSKTYQGIADAITSQWGLKQLVPEIFQGTHRD
jgi:hypothetical protein